MGQVCNYVYSRMIDGKTPAQVAELEVHLSDPADKERMRQKQDIEAQKELEMRMRSAGMFIPPPPPPRKPEGEPK